METYKHLLLSLFGLVFMSRPAWAWYTEGHEIVAVIAADGLTPAAKSHVAQVLGVPADTVSVEKAMAAASIRPDTEFRKDRATPPWHYIGICLQESEADIPARYPQGNCVTAKIDEYARRLGERNYDKWGAAGDLAFLIHFVGDIHQPLHAATNADRGGTCQQVNVTPAEENLHYAWDDAVVTILEEQLGTNDPGVTAHKLEALYPVGGDLEPWKPGESEQIAWESHQLAETDVYRALGIPKRRARCIHATPPPVGPLHEFCVHGPRGSGRRAPTRKAGHRLAALLNQIWIEPK